MSRDTRVGRDDGSQKKEIITKFFEGNFRGINCVYTQARAYTQSGVSEIHLCTHGKQGHMHSGRYCYTHIEIKLANAIVFLPRVAEPICKHQGCRSTKDLLDVIVYSQFQPPKPQLNKNSCVYAECIFISCSKLHFNP